MAIGTKVCQDCQKTVASAKKVCECGHVFLEKKKKGFQEMPIVITPDRLRSSRLFESEANRPVRIKKHKFHGTDFVYSASKSEVMKNNSGNNLIDEGASTSVETNEKYGQFAKRERTKTPKYEDYVSKNKNKNKFPLNPDECRDPEQKSVQNDLIGGTLDEYVSDTDERMLLENEEKKSNENTINISDNERKIEDKHENDKDTTKSLDVSKLLLKDIDASIYVSTDCEYQDCPLLSTLPPDEETFSSDSESFIEDDIVLTKIKIPRHIQNNSQKHIQKSPEIDDIPLSKLMRGVEPFSPSMHIGKDGKLKRPVGRPRKHPIVVKVKRPVGRPRKIRQIEDGYNGPINGHEEQKIKPKRVRAMDGFPYGLYAEHFFYDDEDENDDEADPDYKSPSKTNASQINRTNRTGRACFFSPSQIMERMHFDMNDTDMERWKKSFKAHAFEIPPEKKELYSYILKDINRKIVSQSFKCTF